MNSTHRGNPDFATLAGVVIAIGSVLGGLILEGGSIRDIAQITAAVMVIGGTLGAILISTPLNTLSGAVHSLHLVCFERPATLGQVLEQVLRLSTKSRKNGLASLESDALAMEDPFMKKALNLAVDGTPIPQLRSIMEAELDLEESRLHQQSKVFETAGGYAPTVGIIGAVLGLIQVMKHLENIDEVGRGIAVSFVATVYGVALANLILLPISAKLKARSDNLILIRELTLEGIVGVAEIWNTTLLRLQLESYISPAMPEQNRQVGRLARSPKTAPTAA